MRFGILAILCLWLVSQQGFAQKKVSLAHKTHPPIKIMIDAGHGGKDPGTERTKDIYRHEKDIALAVSMKLGQQIQERISNTKVLYTRKSDIFISLEDRVFMANTKNADFFISIHCNSNPNKQIHGTQVHLHNHSFKKSKKLAYAIDSELQKTAKRQTRGTFNSADREFNLYVLQYTKMPGVLVEIGFLSNAKEEVFLNSTKGQNLLADAITQGIALYLKAEGYQIKLKPKNKKGEIIETEPDEETEVPQNVIVASQSPQTEKSKIDKKAVMDKLKAVEQQMQKQENTMPVVFASNSKKINKVRYRIQIMASPTPVEMTHDYFKKLKMDIEEVKSEEETDIFRYRYLVGNEIDIEKALLLLEEVKKQGYKDAFLTTIQND